jgi:hypothetical protein
VLSPPHINGEELEPHHPKLLGRGLTTTWEPTALALGHSLRKQGALEEALQVGIHDHMTLVYPVTPGTTSGATMNSCWSVQHQRMRPQL